MTSSKDTIRITPGYVAARSLNIGTATVRANGFVEGPITVFVSTKDGAAPPSFDGRLRANGMISGMSKLYSVLRLRPDDEVHFKVLSGGQTAAIQMFPSDAILARIRATPLSAQDAAAGIISSSSTLERVFSRRKLSHIHIEAFSPENLNRWEPRTETDVYMAFGVLAEYTDFRYCCGASADLLRKLGYNFEENAKPDAILIDAITDEYVIAEWKMLSSDFTSNHSKDEIDVLVVWHDDEVDRSKLPPVVVALRGVAKDAAFALIEGAGPG